MRKENLLHLLDLKGKIEYISLWIIFSTLSQCCWYVPSKMLVDQPSITQRSKEMMYINAIQYIHDFVHIRFKKCLNLISSPFYLKFCPIEFYQTQESITYSINEVLTVLNTIKLRLQKTSIQISGRFKPIETDFEGFITKINISRFVYPIFMV